MKECKIGLRVMAKRHNGNISRQCDKYIISRGLLGAMTKLAHAVPQGFNKVDLADHVELLWLDLYSK